MATIKKFEDLKVWNEARTYAGIIYDLTHLEKFRNNLDIIDQINRSAGSIMDNIAEGFEREGNKEFIYFLSIAKASCGESRSQLYRALDRKLINNDDFDNAYNSSISLSKSLSGFILYLKNSKYKGNKFKE